MSKDCSKHTVIEGREELCNVKGDDTSLEASGPARANQVGEKETSIFSRPLRDTTKLVGMKGVEQNNRSKGLRSVVGWFARLRNNDRD